MLNDLSLTDLFADDSETIMCLSTRRECKLAEANITREARQDDETI